MKRLFAVAVFLSLLSHSTPAFSQTSNATVAGTVEDSTGALIPGVTVKATATETGVVTSAVSNETGAYNFPSLLPGTYTFSATLPGFQTQNITGARLGPSTSYRYNFKLSVSSVATQVEVTIPADSILATSGATIGQTLTEKRVSDLPLVGNNVLDLIGVLSGVQNVTAGTFGREGTTFAGVSAAYISTVRDGIMVQDTRWPTGINSATIINPDLVGEIRLILAPVDAEIGRGNGTVQISTRSGTNKYNGAAVWSFRNTALNPNSWVNNRNQTPQTTTSNAIQPNWSNVNQGTVSYGGPIVKNKTFFYALYDQNDAVGRVSTNFTVLTPCGRNGVFRYYDNWNNGNATAATVATGTPTRASVNVGGTPIAPTTNPDGSAHNGVLQARSVFGPLAGSSTKADCSDVVNPGTLVPTGAAVTPWDTYRKAIDPTGFVSRTLAYMPLPNNYEAGDGLNTAGFRWLRHTHGLDNLWGVGEATGVRKQINVKIDQNFTSKHKANVGVSYERVNSDDTVMGWPNTFSNQNFRRPLVVTSSFTSTLSSTLLNEARFGMRRTGTNVVAPWDRPELQEAIGKFLPADVNGFKVIPRLEAGRSSPFDPSGLSLCNPLTGGRPDSNPGSGGCFGGNLTSTAIDVTPVWTYADTLSFTKGQHAFKFGGELRVSSSKSTVSSPGFFDATKTFAQAAGGSAPGAPQATTGPSAVGNTNPTMLGLGTGTGATARLIQNYLAGSLSSVTNLYFLTDPKKLDSFSDYRNSDHVKTEIHQTEYDFFFKDDYKIRKDLTLNLGLRYEYYGVPYVGSGLTVSPVGGGNAMFGISGRSFDNWMKPGAVAYDPNLLTAVQFVGPSSPNPGKTVYPKDRNNFGPAIGFAWQVPWFGAGKTTVRGGYQVTFQGGGRFGALEAPLSTPPGSTYAGTYTGDSTHPYLDLTNLSAALPTPVPIKPMQPFLITDRSASYTAFDANYTTPYVQNMTLSVTRTVRQNLTVDARYVGTLAVKQYRQLGAPGFFSPSDPGINRANFLYNGLGAELTKIREGGESAMLDQMFNGINLCAVGCAAGVTYGPVGQTAGGVAQTAALQMRSSSTFQGSLANGDFNGIATTLNTLNYVQIPGGANSNLPAIGPTVRGAVLRNSGKFSENFITTNPQFGDIYYLTNLDHNNYHSLQTEVTFRPTRGFSGQGTYTWSKNLGSAATYTNPVDRAGDYTVVGGNRTHTFRANGAIELPFGPSKLLFSNSSGAFARAIERWQVGMIYNLSSGQFMSVAAANMIYGNGVPDIVRPFPFDSAGVRWNTKAGSFLEGRYFDPDKFVSVPDPQCSRVTSLQGLNAFGRCSLNALAQVVPAGTADSFVLSDGTNRSAQIVLQNPLPGQRGNMGQNVITGPGSWNFDANLSKAFKISESKSLQFRMDALNVLNHPQPGNPTFALNPVFGFTTPFGQITTKTGGRSFQGQLRFTF